MFFLNGKKFRLARVGLVRAGCPRELQSSAANCNDHGAIVIEANSGGVGRVESTGYTPRAVVTGGARRRERLLDAGIVLSWAYIEAGLEIKADHEIGSGELMQKLQDLINQKVLGTSGLGLVNVPGATTLPWIVEVYPFENYVIYCYKGQKYRQGFNLDPVERIVGLTGPSTSVEEKFVDKVNAEAFMPRVETGVRYAWAPSQSAKSFTLGGKHSELVTQVLRNWTNIVQASQAYLDYIRTSQRRPMQPSFYPVSLSDSGKIMDQLAQRGPGVYDFAAWSASVQEKEPMPKHIEKIVTKKIRPVKADGTPTKMVDGKPLTRDKFGFAPTNNPADWKLPLDTPGRAQNALARINQTYGIPGEKKSAVLSKVRRVATKHGVGVSEKPSSGQKEWANR